MDVNVFFLRDKCTAFEALLIVLLIREPDICHECNKQ